MILLLLWKIESELINWCREVDESLGEECSRWRKKPS